MCDIFPDVSSCCFCITLRIGMLFISVLGIMTGVIGLSTVEHKTHIHFKEIVNLTTSNMSNVEGVLRRSNTLVSTGLSGFSLVFMFTGVFLLLGTLFDSEGLVQLFVWMTFLGVIIGFNMVLAVAVECLIKTECLLSDLDWLSGSIVLVLTVCYLFLWIYFITVANSYVVTAVA